MMKFWVPSLWVVAVASADIVTNVQEDLFFGDDDLLRSHALLHHGCHASSSFLEKPPYGFEFHELAGDAISQVLTDTSGCRAVCIERGVDKEVAHAAMPHKQYDESQGKTLAAWFENSCRKIEVCLLNYHDKETPVKLFWVHPETNENVLHLEIAYGEKHTRCFSSFLGHKFEAQDGKTGEIIGSITVEYVLVLAFGEAPPSDDASKHNFDTEIEATLHEEWRRHNRVQRTFSPLGFKKGRLPPDVYASMRAFFNNNRGNKVAEEWQGRGVFVNWWEIDCSFIQIPWDLKRKWQIRLRELVEAWAGIPVEQTDMYGLRQYEAGARLLTHVDRITTHAVSLIVNIAQGNLTEPWPVEVHDHADRLHEVIMRPGDIVYYESAKCLHSRNRPLTGPNAYYVNLFTHYRPTGDPEWYEKPNHDGTPDAVLATSEANCRLEYSGTTESRAAGTGGQLGLVQAVKCDDARLGQHISPSLFTATSGDDLIDWWRRTAPTPTCDAGGGTTIK